MATLVQVESSSGAVLFEGEFSEAALEEIGIKDKVEDVVTATSNTVHSIAATVRGVATDLLAAFDDLATPANSGGSLSCAEIELGVTLSGEGNILIARGSAEANLKVKLTWNFG